MLDAFAFPAPASGSKPYTGKPSRKNNPQTEFIAEKNYQQFADKINLCGY
jgi:hypothetical protein